MAININMDKKEKYITFNCDWCGNEHSQTIGNYNRNNIHFCSQSCVSNYRWNKHRKDNNINLDEIIDCACGCGNKLNRWHKLGNNYRDTKFINGHVGNVSNSGQFKKGEVAWNKGIPSSNETKLKLSISAKEQFKDGISKEVRIRMSCSRRNIEIEDFEGFVVEDDPRKNFEERTLHTEWRRLVFERDNYTCQICGDKSGNGHKVILNAHHIKDWKNHPELRRELTNGITLCSECHYYVHSKEYKNELEIK